MESKTPPSDRLAAWLRSQRWFAAKTRRIESLAAEDTIGLAGAGIVIARVRLEDGAEHRYAIPLNLERVGSITDATEDPSFCRGLFHLVGNGGATASERGGELRGYPTSVFPRPAPAQPTVRLLGGEQSNTSMVFEDRLILKFFRRLTEGVNPEQEITRFLTERTTFRNTPRLAGHLDYRAPAGETSTLAVVQDFVKDARDGWAWTVEQIRAFYARALASGLPPRPDVIAAAAERSLGALRHLGGVTAHLHRALASDPNDPAFAPEPITAPDVTTWAQAVRRQLEAACDILDDRTLSSSVGMPKLAESLADLVGRHKIRHHGDLHLGQTLYQEARADFTIIDFEGEPLRPLAERRQKHSALRDVAGVLRSIDYAATFAPDTGVDTRPWAEAWTNAAAREFVAGYRAGARGAGFVPDSAQAFARVVAVFELEKAAYEVVYEANHRPQWVEIPRRGLVRAASRLTPSASAGAA
jgi:maltose alpha-D-glucosyltransferase/alpha-amylase